MRYLSFVVCSAMLMHLGHGQSLPPVPSPFPAAPQAAPSDPDATAELKRFAKHLYTVANGPSFYFGHHNVNWKGQHWSNAQAQPPFRSDFGNTTGYWPGVTGYNLDWVVDGRNANLSGLVEDAAGRGLLLHFYWEASNPVTNGSANDPTGSPITAIMPGGSANGVWRAWMDKVAAFLRGVRQPVVLRLFHEATGGWFWWGEGNSTPEQYKAAFKYTARYLQQQGGVHNAVIAYAPSKPAASGSQWQLAYGAHGSQYPGDDLVDVVCFDHYSLPFNGSLLLQDCERVTSLALQRGKIPAMCEFGVSKGVENSKNPELFNEQFLEPLKASYWCQRIAFAYTWFNSSPESYWVPLPGQLTTKSFQKLAASNLTILGPPYNSS